MFFLTAKVTHASKFCTVLQCYSNIDIKAQELLKEPKQEKDPGALLLLDSRAFRNADCKMYAIE